jgi:hypothetical protein
MLAKVDKPKEELMHQRIFATLLAIGLILALSSCDEIPAPPTVGSVVTIEGETISEATTWTSDNLYYIKGCVGFQSAITIEPGTIVAFGADATMTIDAGGQLNATGTVDAPIIFTSAKEDFADFTIPGVSGSPAIGDWDYVYIQGNSSTLQNCIIRYSGRGIEAAANNVTVRNNLFTSNTIALDARSVGTGFIVGGNTFYGNTHPFYAYRNFSIDNTNIFQNGDGSIKNTYQAIEIQNGSIDASLTWGCTTVAVVAYDPGGWFAILSPNTLTLSSGVVVKFAAGGEFTIDDGATLANYANADFTSIKDDTFLGDSNGDGAASTPATDDWVGIYNYNGVDAYMVDGGEVFLHHCTND